MKIIKNFFYYLMMPVLAIVVLTIGEHKWVAIPLISVVILQLVVDKWLRSPS